MGRRLVASVLLCTIACFGMLGVALGLGWSPHLGLDLEGGLSVVYKPVRPVDQATLQNVANIMVIRVNGLGVSQPNITTQGGDVVVQLPGAKNQQTILDTIGKTAQIYFRPVLCEAPAYSGPKLVHGQPPAYKVPPTCPSQYNFLQSGTYDSSTQNYVPPAAGVDPQYASYPTTTPDQDDTDTVARQNVILPIGAGTSNRYVLGPAVINNQIVNGQIISKAYAALDTQTNQWVVVFDLTGKGSTLFNALAHQYYGQLVADDLDGSLISVPIIESQSFPGSGQVSGNFNQASANQLGQLLSSGALPVTVKPLTTEIVSPTLGKASLHAGLLAGLLGLLLVMLYTIFYYRALGIVVVLGLVTTAAFLYGFISLLSASSLGLTLDLSGVTGLIVSVGITVDSYIVYFERLKDEVRAGRSIRAAVDRGFRSAYRTILSADAVSFIGALVLWLLSVGAVRGFAFMLGLSTLVDVVTAYIFTRPLVILLGRNRVFTEARHLGVARGLAFHEGQ
ncbi:MAG TPA: protein translocase subunit SecD [Acidimicrobiales bacterium]|nr:protein translocase subunit SecD [Acidimicrobiales bacterium]